MSLQNSESLEVTKVYVLEHSNLVERRYGYGLPAMHPTGWVRSGFRVGRALGFNCAGAHGSSASRPLASGMCFPHFLSGPGTPGGNLSSGRASAAILPQ